MKHTFRRAVAAVAVLTLVVACHGGEPAPPPSMLKAGTPVTVGMVNDLPGLSIGTTKLAGFDNDLVAALQSSLGAELSPTLLNANDRESYLGLHKATLVIASYSITPARRAAGVDFAGPYMISPLAFMVRAGEKRFTNAAAIPGKRVCTVAGTTGEPVDLPGAVLVHANTHQDCVTMMAAGNADAVFSDAVVLYGFTHANQGKYKVVLPGVFGSNQYYGVGLAEGHHADCLRLDKAIADYLRVQWRHDFEDTLQDAVAAYPGNSPGGDFESHFKPTDTDMLKLSCQSTP